MKLAIKLSFYLIKPSSPLCFCNALYLEKSSSKAKFTQVGKKWRKTLFHCLWFNFLQLVVVLRLYESWILGTLIHSTSNPLSNMPNAHVYDAPPPILKLMLPAKVKLISYGSFAFFYLFGQADQYTRQWLGSICWQLKRPHLAVPNVNSQHWKGWVRSLTNIKSRPYYYCPQFPIAEL